MKQETRDCQNCKTAFVIEPEDFDFYKKIAVPPPTWCPECRLWRRMAWRNDKFLYRSTDAHNGENMFSMYPASAPVTVYEKEFWNSDNWDQLATGREYDFSKPFFEQFKNLLVAAPVFSRSIVNLVNSDYSNNATALKNCYLVFGTSYTEDSLYSENCAHSKDLMDCTFLNRSESSYESFFNIHCYRSVFSSHCEDSSDIWFCRDCVGVSNCFGCVGLKNKSYYWFNEQLSEQEYTDRLNTAKLSSYLKFKEAKERARNFWLKFPVRYRHGRKNEDVSGEYLYNSKNVKESYYVVEGENLKFCQYLYTPPAKDAYDQYRYGDNTSLVYECLSVGGHSAGLKFCAQSYTNCNDLEYCYNVLSSRNCFGCVGLHHKQYCILNKQYTKEEYDKLVPKIIEHMNVMPYKDRVGRIYRYGEFFPLEISPYPYNHTIAQEFFPKRRDELGALGEFWIESGERNYKPTISAVDFPDRIEDVPDSIVNEIVGCSHGGTCGEECTTAFRILKEELAFYRKLKLPLPRLCSNCRYAERIKQRSPIKLWHRACMCDGKIYQNTGTHPHGTGKCPTEFETSYAPDRPEIVYCEQCYNAEVA